MPTAPLVYDDQKSEPGVHALVIGVSAYVYVRGGSAQPTNPALKSLAENLSQLVGPANSARNLSNFLFRRKAELVKPLRTLRLLASPSPPEKEHPDDFVTAPTVTNFDSILPATAQNITSALTEWQRDCSRSDQEVAFFYFGGHGAQISRTNSILLASDFLGGPSVFDRSIEVNDIWLGMAKSKFVATIAQNQFYFIDSCRVDYSLFKEIKRSGTLSPFVVQDLGADQRTAPIFFAAGPGQETKSFPDKKITRFGERLLKCLSGEAGEPLNDKWCVTVGQLTTSLSKFSQVENSVAGVKIDSFDIGGIWGDYQATIHNLDGPPTIDCKVRFTPTEMRKAVSLVLDNFKPPPLRLERPLDDPHKFQCLAGTYMIATDPGNGVSPGFLTVKPPFTEVLVEDGRFVCL